jgi:hypothetical protein
MAFLVPRVVAVFSNTDNSLMFIEIKVEAIERKFIGSSSVVPMNKLEREEII